MIHHVGPMYIHIAPTNFLQTYVTRHKFYLLMRMFISAVTWQISWHVNSNNQGHGMRLYKPGESWTTNFADCKKVTESEQ